MAGIDVSHLSLIGPPCCSGDRRTVKIAFINSSLFAGSHFLLLASSSEQLCSWRALPADRSVIGMEIQGQVLVIG